MDFSGKTALIIGGSGGIGRELALGLADRGANLVIHGGNSPERLESALAELRKRAAAARPARPAAISGFLCALGRDMGPEQAADYILAKARIVPELTRRALKERGSPPDMLICSWGPFIRAPLIDTNPKIWHSLIENNLIFPGILISGVLHDMLDRRWGRILLFGGTGTAEVCGFTTTVAYSAAKTALGVLAKSAAKTALEAGAPGVTCNVICPGLTDTEYTAAADRVYNREHSPGGAMESWEIARAALGVLENSAINGAVLPIDRGIALMGFDKTYDKR
jgi:3-oxoacyl-[acyl-carrier protein] reductase